MSNGLHTETEQAFVPKVTAIKGIGDYLSAEERKRWFRNDNPKGSIKVEVLLIDIERGYAGVKALVTAEDGGYSENYGSAVREAPGQPLRHDFLEYATTTAISRALAALGYGTGDALAGPHEKLADAPISGGSGRSNGNPPQAQRPAQQQAPAVQGEKVAGGATVKQVNAIFAIGKSKWGYNRAGTIAAVRESFGKVPDDLNGTEASEVIKWLNDNNPA